jgi:integrase
MRTNHNYHFVDPHASIPPHAYRQLEGYTMMWLNEKYDTAQWSAKTVQRRVSSLKSFTRFLGWPAFLETYKAPTPAKAVPHPLPDGMDDVNAMLGRCETGRERALIVLCGYMGLRVGEALGVRAGHVDVPNRWLEVKLGKGRRERGVPIPEKAVTHLLFRLDACASPLTPLVDVSDRTARRWITEIGERAGVERRVSSHDLRATAATHWYKMTKDLRTTQELLGHQDARTTEIYTGISNDEMRKAINA